MFSLADVGFFFDSEDEMANLVANPLPFVVG